MTFFKRSATDRDLTFRVPDYNCFACNDSGIVHNSDGYLSNELPGYDQNYDLAIICSYIISNCSFDKELMSLG